MLSSVCVPPPHAAGSSASSGPPRGWWWGASLPGGGAPGFRKDFLSLETYTSQSKTLPPPPPQRLQCDFLKYFFFMAVRRMAIGKLYSLPSSLELGCWDVFCGLIFFFFLLPLRLFLKDSPSFILFFSSFFFSSFIPLSLLSFCLRRASKKTDNPPPTRANRPFLESS